MISEQTRKKNFKKLNKKDRTYTQGILNILSLKRLYLFNSVVYILT